jgi:hypothetical protein
MSSVSGFKGVAAVALALCVVSGCGGGDDGAIPATVTTTATVTATTTVAPDPATATVTVTGEPSTTTETVTEAVTSTETATVTQAVTTTETATVTETASVAGFVGPGDAGGGDEDEDESWIEYDNCDAARAAGAAPVYAGDPGYGRHLDRDGDGVGCES